MSFPLPASVSVDPETGEMTGRTRRYEKRFDDLAGLFADYAAQRPAMLTDWREGGSGDGGRSPRMPQPQPTSRTVFPRYALKSISLGRW